MNTSEHMQRLNTSNLPSAHSSHGSQGGSNRPKQKRSLGWYYLEFQYEYFPNPRQRFLGRNRDNSSQRRGLDVVESHRWRCRKRFLRCCLVMSTKGSCLSLEIVPGTGSFRKSPSAPCGYIQGIQKGLVGDPTCATA